MTTVPMKSSAATTPVAPPSSRGSGPIRHGPASPKKRLAAAQLARLTAAPSPTPSTLPARARRQRFGQQQHADPPAGQAQRVQQQRQLRQAALDAGEVKIGQR